MKLLTKSTYYFFIFFIPVIIAGGVFLYSAIRKDIYKQIDSSLITEKNIIQDQIEQTDKIPDFSSEFGHQIEVKLLSPASLQIQQIMQIKDTLISEDSSGIDLPYRYLNYSGLTPKSTGYTIKIFQILSEKKELLEAISVYLSGLFLSIIIISLLFYYFIARKLWSPFYKSVDKADSFDILSDNPLVLPETDIIEFQRMNRVFGNMTRKMRTDYLNLKEYNENAAHEFQTPLAVIRSKTELLAQTRHLKKESLNLIRSINDATDKLLKLNQGLLLISKIDNQYFYEKKEVSLKQITETCLENYREIMELKKIRVENTFSDPAVVEMNEVLADVLISNLLSNAVRYNIDKGFIICQIDNRSVSFKNSGLPLNCDPESLFHRFHKGSDNPQSVGLGLSIVRKITEYYKMSIQYSCTGNIHEVRLNYRTGIIF